MTLQDSLDYLDIYTDSFRPEIGMILGSGLGELGDRFCEYAIPYTQIPGFVPSSVEGHKGRLVFAHIEGKKVVMMQGRIHYYEGYTMGQVTYPVKVMKKLGVKTIILTNAAGIVNKGFRPGDLMLITDHINFMGSNPLIGANDSEIGPRFPDMSQIYDKDLIKLSDNIARDLKLNVRHGVYMATSGPCYETPAEIKMAGILGADAVGMSTIPEAIVSNYCGMKVLGVSCLSNYASGISDRKLSHTEVLEMTNAVKGKFFKLIFGILKSNEIC